MQPCSYHPALGKGFCVSAKTKIFPEEEKQKQAEIGSKPAPPRNNRLKTSIKKTSGPTGGAWVLRRSGGRGEGILFVRCVGCVAVVEHVLMYTYKEGGEGRLQILGSPAQLVHSSS